MHSAKQDKEALVTCKMKRKHKLISDSIMAIRNMKSYKKTYNYIILKKHDDDNALEPLPTCANKPVLNFREDNQNIFILLLQIPAYSSYMKDNLNYL